MNDALPNVSDMVKTVSGYGQPALGLTDHGNMGGTVQLYKHCMNAGIKPFPGSELYVVHDRNDKKAKRHHMCVVAYNSQGYKNLVKISTHTHQNFYNKPIIDHTDLAEMSESGLLEGIAATSGCYFGFIAQAVTKGDAAYAQTLMKTYDKWFGQFYVELQNHGIDHEDGWTDDLLANELFHLAVDAGIPAILTQDSHYCDTHDKETHDALKRLVAFGPEADDAVFPGDGFHLADTEWFLAHHTGTRLAYGTEGLAHLLDSHDLSIPQLDSYNYSIPFTVADPQKELQRRMDTAVADMDEQYKARMNEEMSIIADTGMAGYLLLVSEVTDWCRANSIFYQARGSASGSMVCWKLGITQVDPIKWGLSFDRFISRDRTKPPDIDLDIEHNRRQDLIDWLGTKFSVTQIGTWLEYKITPEEDGESKGSLLIKYYAGNRRRGSGALRWEEVPPQDRASLQRISDHRSFASYGTHAAGLVITTTEDECANLVPVMKVASSGTFVTQYEMGDIESLGLVKLDVLGLKTLSVLHQCMENLGRDVFEGLEWIPLNDAETYREIAKGNTEGVFQLEGYTASRGCKQLKPTNINDVIAAMALFRPAAMNPGATDQYINRKHKKEKIPVTNPIIQKYTSHTYGVLLFQEQVIGILRELGMNPDDLTAFLKAVKASNADIGDAGVVIRGYRNLINDMAIDADFTKKDWDWFWESISGFAAYGFNQAHSTAYGLTAYRCAYLATHHPVEFYAAVLAVAAGTPKEVGYLASARKRGIKVRRADINDSNINYSVDSTGKAIRKGLSSVKGVGLPTAEEIINKRPTGGYKDMSEFCHLVDRRKVTGVKPYLESQDMSVGIVGKLNDIGVLDAIA